MYVHWPQAWGSHRAVAARLLLHSFQTSTCLWFSIVNVGRKPSSCLLLARSGIKVLVPFCSQPSMPPRARYCLCKHGPNCRFPGCVFAHRLRDLQFPEARAVAYCIHSTADLSPFSCFSFLQSFSQSSRQDIDCSWQIFAFDPKKTGQFSSRAWAVNWVLLLLVFAYYYYNSRSWNEKETTSFCQQAF